MEEIKKRGRKAGVKMTEEQKAANKLKKDIDKNENYTNILNSIKSIKDSIKKYSSKLNSVLVLNIKNELGNLIKSIDPIIEANEIKEKAIQQAKIQQEIKDLIDKLEKLGVKVPTPVQNVLEVLDLNGVTESVKTAQNVIKNLGLDKNDESTNINK